MAHRPDDIILCSPMPLPEAAGAAPDWVHLFPAGVAHTVDGRGPFRLGDAAKVIAASMVGGRPLPIDESHAIDLAEPQGRPAPARGWIVEMQTRSDGIWARVEWTATGAASVAERAFRWLSPVILASQSTGELVRILRASLTNNPNLVGLASLNAAGGDLAHPTEKNMDLAKLREAMGLSADADEAAILAAATASRAAADQAASVVSTHAAALASIGEAVGAAKDADATVVLAAVRAAVDPAKRVPADQVAQLQSQLTALTQSVAREKAVAYVDAAIVAGKVGVKPLRDHYIARHMADPAGVEKELGAMPSLHAAGGARKTAAPEGDALSDDERRVVEMMGVDPKAYAKTRAELHAKEAV